MNSPIIWRSGAENKPWPDSNTLHLGNARRARAARAGFAAEPFPATSYIRGRDSLQCVALALRILSAVAEFVRTRRQRTCTSAAFQAVRVAVKRELWESQLITCAVVLNKETGFVNLRQTVELTGIISEHSPNWIEASVPLPTAALQRYREATAEQTQRWSRALDELPRKIADAAPGQRAIAWQRGEPVLVDVLAGGLVARVW